MDSILLGTKKYNTQHSWQKYHTILTKKKNIKLTSRKNDLNQMLG